MSRATYRQSWWREFRRENQDARFKVGVSLNLFDDDPHFSLCLFGLWVPLWFLNRWAYEPYEIMESWGFGYDHELSCVHLNWGRRYKSLDMPWSWTHIKHEVRRPDGSWVPYVGSYEVGPDKPPDGRWQETYPYRYVLRNGTVQDRLATIYVDRHERRRKCLKWLPLFARKQPCIYVDFNDEVGERTGSWKGGTVGCGYRMLPGEDPLMTLRRMERDREF